MLAITENAATAIKGLAASRDLPEDGGIRIAPRDDGGVERLAALQVSLADSPADEDAIVEEYGAHVFLERNAASFLDDKVLDVRVENRRARFVIGQPD
jgi:iron-sulfur cluster assembly protein